MRRLLLAWLASLALYGAAFAFLLQRPLSLGTVFDEVNARVARGASLMSPKLVIIAGSNGPYSHRCTVIAPALGLPCVNAGVATGIGVDYLFARWKALLRAGDVVYLPMELAQYTRGRAANRLGPDAAIMWRQDWATLAELPADRWLGAFFSSDLRGVLMSGVEMALAPLHAADQRAAVEGESDAEGDHVGHTAALAAANAAALAAYRRVDPSAGEIARGYGADLIAEFVRWGTAHGVRVIGGLPTEFDDVALPPDTVAAVRAVYEANGGLFVVLPNLSRYPRAAFFDSPDHLNETWQIVHSQAVAGVLVPVVAPRSTSAAR